MNDAVASPFPSSERNQFPYAICAHRHIALRPAELQALNETILELVCGDEVVVQRFVRLLVDTNQTTLAALRDAFSTSTWDAVASAAHRIAGSARMLGCTGLVALLVQLETAARQREPERARALLQVVADTIDALDRALQELLYGKRVY